MIDHEKDLESGKLLIERKILFILRLLKIDITPRKINYQSGKHN